MNEFIVWDKKNKIFCSGIDILNDNDGQFESFDYVMMDDNGTKIYENSTIFEFDFYEYESTKTTKRYFFNLLSTKKVEYKYVNKGGAVAIFEWDNKKLCYNISNIIIAASSCNQIQRMWIFLGYSRGGFYSPIIFHFYSHKRFLCHNGNRYNRIA